jgi:glycogen operon protein
VSVAVPAFVPTGPTPGGAGLPAAWPVALQAGTPWPLGASVTDAGVNVAVWSGQATRVQLCVFDAAGHAELARYELPAREGDVFHGLLPGAGEGLVYGLRVHGPWAPAQGHKFNPAKLLLDPWAREVVGPLAASELWHEADPARPGEPDPRDSAPVVPKARVVAASPWPHPRGPRHADGDLVLHELHIKGFTRQHPGVPDELRGTYAGLAHEASLAHLRALGVTAVSLLPVALRLDEPRLQRMGLVNHWGYNTLGFFCPEPRLAAAARAAHDPADPRAVGRAVRAEFRDMVRRLHEAGLEVILDVVFNHSAESDAQGPCLSWRGLDNAGWYRLPPHDRAGYVNDTGCGNTFDLERPRVLQFVMDSLRFWAGEMGVDGFRFDLAPVLGRRADGFHPDHAFFQAVAQDPLLSRCRLIAEPWDTGPGGYQLGRFPAGWAEWNDRFRDGLRAFWVTGSRQRDEFARRLCGSSDVFEGTGRAPAASVNFVVAHDGFTLADLVSYAHRHNLANGEHNRDGHAHNHNRNCGVEGPTDDPAIRRLRGRLQRALLASTLFAQGTPMLAAGDELGHSQQGNNNPYCQDNPTTWIAWQAADAELLAFTRRAVALRRALWPLGPHWYHGRADETGQPDLQWLDADGQPMRDDQWGRADRRVLGLRIGRPGRARGPLLLWVNAGEADQIVPLPPGAWLPLLDSTDPVGRAAPLAPTATTFVLRAHGLVLMATAGADPIP